MDILISVKRVPDTGAKLVLTKDEKAIDTSKLGFTISPHEECAVEEAVQITEKEGGFTTVLTLGPEEAEDQLRESLARGIERGLLLKTEGEEWDPLQTSHAIVQAIQNESKNGQNYDLFLFGNESADSGDFQVGIRVAQALGVPCVTGVKSLEVKDGKAIAKREIATGWEIYEVPLPAVIGVKEGLNLPRHPSLRGTMKAKKKTVDIVTPESCEAGLPMKRLSHPPEQKKQVEILGKGPEAAPKVIEVLKDLEVF